MGKRLLFGRDGAVHCRFGAQAGRCTPDLQIIIVHLPARLYNCYPLLQQPHQNPPVESNVLNSDPAPVLSSSTCHYCSCYVYQESTTA